MNRNPNKNHSKSRLLALVDNLSEDQLLILIKRAEELLADIDRQDLRKFYTKRINFRIQDQEYEGTIQNISCSGVFILTEGSFPIGSEVFLQLSIEGNQDPIKITGEIARISPEGIGIKFRNLAKQNEDLIKSLIDSC
jgi:Tfp pilus assembly protein PilZ